VLELQHQHGFRVHVDAAYGGYFTLARNLSPSARAAFDAISQADSLVIDPHKHGLQPYGCGCVLLRDPSDGRFYKHDSPYTYFSSGELHLGEISLECSRAGAAAVALWTTMRMLPLEKGGTFALGLEAGREAAQALHSALAFHENYAPLLMPELDIVTWAVRAPSATASSAGARMLFEAAQSEDLHLALAEFPRLMAEPCGAIGTWDAESVTCLRACCMKPAHRDWMPQILERLNRAGKVLTS
jgi:glutamate/tyrosine decarboxylase-like PLP-dependent enzyme